MPSGEIESIGEFWKESHVAVQQILATEPAEGVVSVLDSYAIPATATLILLFFLLMFPMLANGLFSTAASLFNTKRLLLVEESSSMKSNREILLLFWILVLSFIAAGTLTRFLLYAACIMLFLLLRRGCLAILGKLSTDFTTVIFPFGERQYFWQPSSMWQYRLLGSRIWPCL